MSRSEARAAGARATSLELFFDLVYVFAFTQVTHLMADGGSARSVLQGLAVLGILWWSWASHAWLANHRAADYGVVRVGILSAIAIVLLLSIAIPDVFPDDGSSTFGPLLFACGFVILSVVYTVVNVLASGPNAAFRRQVVRTMGATIVPVALALVIGAAMGGMAQLCLWLAAVVIEGITVYVSSRGGEWQLHSAGHYAERHGLVVLLALGESIISIGLGAAHSGLAPATLAASLLAVFVALGMWWNYFDRLSSRAEAYLEGLPDGPRTAAATFGTYLHLGIVAGILLVSLGLGSALEHIREPEPLGSFSAAVLGGGLSLFLASTAGYAWRTSAAVRPERTVAAAVSLCVVPGLALIPSFGAITAVLAIVIALTVAEGLAAARDARDRQTRRGESLAALEQPDSKSAY